MKNDSIRTLAAFAIFWIGFLTVVWTYSYSPESAFVRSESPETATVLENLIESPVSDAASVDFNQKIEDMMSADMSDDIRMLENRPEGNPEDGIYKLSLPNKKAFYLKILGMGHRGEDWCGSGGCTYFAYIVKSSNEVSLITGFDYYRLDCDTNKISLVKDNDGSLFGTPSIDKANRVVRIYYSFGGGHGSENVYYINDDGSPTLIASYDRICQENVVALFRHKDFSDTLTFPSFAQNSIGIESEIVWTGTPRFYMTYGRLLIKNLDPDAKYKYFIAEPDDVIEDGTSRYSPTTGKVGDGDVVKITGKVSDWCYWDDVTSGADNENVEYKGCVPWVGIEKLEVVK